MIGGCEDEEFAADSHALWQRFVDGADTLVLSAHTLRELEGAPDKVRRHVERVPPDHLRLLPDSREAWELAEAYLSRGLRRNPGSRCEALHVALATVGDVDAFVSWSFSRRLLGHGRLRVYNSVNLREMYGPLEMWTPKEALKYAEEL